MKKVVNPNAASKEKKVVYPSSFGSHASMIDAQLTEKLARDGFVVCVDDVGPYITTEVCLDNGLADLNRHASAEARDVDWELWAQEIAAQIEKSQEEEKEMAK